MYVYIYIYIACYIYKKNIIILCENNYQLKVQVEFKK